MNRLILPVLVFISSFAFAQAPGYRATDFTAENLFTENIEGPNFARDGKLYVVNFQKDGTIGYVHSDGTVELFVTLPEGSIANAIQFDQKGNMLLADFKGHNILEVNMTSKAVSVLCHNDKFNQPNDICINKKGQLFASDPNWKASSGQVWRIEKDGKSVLVASDMGTTNGIELSPDEKILYVGESVQRKIWAFTVDAKGNLSDKRLFFEFPDFGMDGMKCDKDGNLYVCRYGKGTIAILSPDKELKREVILKGKKVSNITFGGKDKKSCFVTLQDRKGMETFRSEVAGKQ
jgi:gluconolactonase